MSRLCGKKQGCGEERKHGPMGWFIVDATARLQPGAQLLLLLLEKEEEEDAEEGAAARAVSPSHSNALGASSSTRERASSKRQAAPTRYRAWTPSRRG